jgi:hypothetical protein
MIGSSRGENIDPRGLGTTWGDNADIMVNIRLKINVAVRDRVRFS